MDQNNYWEKRYEENNTGWDIGDVSTPLVEYLDQLENKEITILFPGAGYAFDAEYAFKKGFKNVWVADIAQTAAERFFKRVPDFPKSQFIVGDFFAMDRKFDLIIEQTFYCALPPGWRDKYVQQMHKLLTKGGKLAGVLFTFPLTEKGPPFGGSIEEYQERFSKMFKVKTLKPCYNSIKPRMGNEVFIIAEKPKN